MADAWHGHGIATVLLAHLAHAASTAGIDTFTATVLAGNHRMLGVFHESGFLVSARRSEGAIEIEFPTSLSQDARRRFEERQREADVAAVGHVLRPSSVAVIGASRRPGTVGGEVVRNLLAAGFSGPLHLVNVGGGEVAGRPTVPTIADVEGEVELAVIVVPTNAVVDVARACAAKGVRALVVLTGGFAEVGPAGRARQDELLAVCRAAGMRMVGPNSLGVASPRPEIALDATVAPVAPPPGDVGFASQSGWAQAWSSGGRAPPRSRRGGAGPPACRQGRRNPHGPRNRNSVVAPLPHSRPARPRETRGVAGRHASCAVSACRRSV